MKPGKILEMLVTLSFTMLARIINTVMSFEWQEKNAGKEKNTGEMVISGKSTIVI